MGKKLSRSLLALVLVPFLFTGCSLFEKANDPEELQKAIDATEKLLEELEARRDMLLEVEGEDSEE